MTERRRSIGIFNDVMTTEAALEELDNSHYSLDRVFVIARDQNQEKKVVGTQLCESLRDRFDTKISSLAEQDSSISDGGTTISLAKALADLDIPIDIARQYNDSVAGGKYLVMVEGNENDILGAKSILKRCGIQDWVVYQITLEHPEVIIVDRRDDS